MRIIYDRVLYLLWYGRDMFPQIFADDLIVPDPKSKLLRASRG